MHDLPDTDEQDALEEAYWPEEYKDLIREKLPADFLAGLNKNKDFEQVFNDHYAERFRDYEEFIGRLAEMVVIGAERGADKRFEEVYSAFRRHAPLPDVRAYARYFKPEPLSQDLAKEIHDKLYEEYRGHHAYEHVHEDHYEGLLGFDTFVHHIAEVVVTGVKNGADDMLGRIYNSFLTGSSLPTARRRARPIRAQ